MKYVVNYLRKKNQVIKNVIKQTEKGVTRLFTSPYSTCTPRFVEDNFSSSHFIHVYIVTLFFYHPRYWTWC